MQAYIGDLEMGIRIRLILLLFLVVCGSGCLQKGSSSEITGDSEIIALAQDYVKALATSNEVLFLNLLSLDCKEFYDKKSPCFLSTMFSADVKDYTSYLHSYSEKNVHVKVFRLKENDAHKIESIRSYSSLTELLRLHITYDINTHHTIGFWHYIGRSKKNIKWRIIFPDYTDIILYTTNNSEITYSPYQYINNIDAIAISNTARLMIESGYTNDSIRLLQKGKTGEAPQKGVKKGAPIRGKFKHKNIPPDRKGVKKLPNASRLRLYSEVEHHSARISRRMHSANACRSEPSRERECSGCGVLSKACAPTETVRIAVS